MTTAEFFAAHPVFSLEEAAEAVVLPDGTAGAVQRLKHHVRKGRLKIVTRGVYAVVPPGVTAERFSPMPSSSRRSRGLTGSSPTMPRSSFLAPRTRCSPRLLCSQTHAVIP